MFCAPDKERQKISCFTKKSLIKIAKSYNETFKDTKKISITKKSKKKLWSGIREKLSSKRTTEFCWIDKKKKKKTKSSEILKHTFRPKKPKSWNSNKYEWLSTIDINKVMKQYENKYKDFLFIGPVPRDCYMGSSLSCELTNLRLDKLIKYKIYKLGIVYNLDYSYMSGSHWVAVYLDIDDKSVTYYDSYGHKPPAEIQGLMDNFKYKLAGMGIKIKDKFNNKRHQYGGSECGIYSMNYIIERLKGKKHYEITKRKIPDKLMNDMRNYLYRNN